MQSSQRCWDGERGGRWRATTNTGLSRQSLRDHDAAALRHGLSRCATRRRITAASTLRVCRATRTRMPSSRHTKTPASQATRIPRQIRQCTPLPSTKTASTSSASTRSDHRRALTRDHEHRAVAAIASRPLPLRLSFVVCRPSSNVHEVTGLFQCVLAATSFAEATVVKKNAKGAKKWKTSDY